MADIAPIPPPIDPNTLYDTDHAALLFGCGRTVIQTRMQLKELRFRKVGGLTRFLGKDLLDYLDSVVQKTDADLEAEMKSKLGPAARRMA